MFFCPYCGVELDSSAKFCPKCGKAVAPFENVMNPPAAPAAPAVVAAPAAPAVSAKSRVLGFVGMGLGIEGLIVAIMGALYSLLFLLVDGGMAFGYAIALGAFSMPSALIAMRLCQESMNQGFRSKVCSIGSKLGLAALIITCAMLLLGFIGMLASV